MGQVSSTDAENRPNGTSSTVVSNGSGPSDIGGARPRTRSNDVEAIAIPTATVPLTPSRTPNGVSIPHVTTPSRVPNGTAPSLPVNEASSSTPVIEEPLPPGYTCFSFFRYVFNN